MGKLSSGWFDHTGLIDPLFAHPEEILEELESPTNLTPEELEHRRYTFIEDTIEAMKWWHCFTPEFHERSRLQPSPAQPSTPSPGRLDSVSGMSRLSPAAAPPLSARERSELDPDQRRKARNKAKAARKKKGKRR